MLSLLKKLISAFADGCEIYGEMMRLSDLSTAGPVPDPYLTEHLLLPPPVYVAPWFTGNYPITQRRNSAHLLLALPYGEPKNYPAWGKTEGWADVPAS